MLSRSRSSELTTSLTIYFIWWLSKSAYNVWLIEYCKFCPSINYTSSIIPCKLGFWLVIYKLKVVCWTKLWSLEVTTVKIVISLRGKIISYQGAFCWISSFLSDTFQVSQEGKVRKLDYPNALYWKEYKGLVKLVKILQ